MRTALATRYGWRSVGPAPFVMAEDTCSTPTWLYADIVWFSFGREDIGQELRDVKTLLGVIMAMVQVDQTALDSIGTELGTIADAVQAIVDDNSNDLGPADLGAITGAVSRMQTVLASTETPVEPGGSDVPAEPEAEQNP